MKEKLVNQESDNIKFKESAVEKLVEKEKIILELRGKLTKSENFFQNQLEKCKNEINQLKEKVELYESDDYYNYLEEEIMKNYEDEKDEFLEEIEALNKKIDNYEEM